MRCTRLTYLIHDKFKSCKDDRKIEGMKSGARNACLKYERNVIDKS